MATRSRIGYEMKSGSIRHIYSHWDGYPSNNGKLLVQHYNTYGKIKQLIDGGDISSLGPEIGEKHDFDDQTVRDRMTTFYGRDRGEEGTKAKVSKTKASYANPSRDGDIEFYYLFKDGEWQVFDSYGTKKWEPVKKVLGMEGIENEEEIHGESNPFAENMLKVIKGQYNLQEEQMAQNNDTAIKIQREAKKTALRLYKTIYDNLFLASQALLEMPKEYVDGSTFGNDGPFSQVYRKVKETLDAMTKVAATPETMTPEEVMPIEEPSESPSEVPVGGEEDLEPVSVE